MFKTIILFEVSLDRYWEILWRMIFKIAPGAKTTDQALNVFFNIIWITFGSEAWFESDTLIQIIWCQYFFPYLRSWLYWFYGLSVFNFLTARYFVTWFPFRTFISLCQVGNNYLDILSTHFREERQYFGKSNCTELL